LVIAIKEGSDTENIQKPITEDNIWTKVKIVKGGRRKLSIARDHNIFHSESVIGIIT
jgi:hypothetical protein